jgi:hypothetical protein
MDSQNRMMSNRFLAVLAIAVLAVAALVLIAGMRLQNAGAAPVDVNISEDNNGRTLTVTPNSTVHLVLHSTYWNVQPVSDAQILQSLHEPVVTPDLAGHVPGSGAGTVAVDYKAVAGGTVKVQASRQTCGEALRCTGDQGSFAVTIVVGS